MSATPMENPRERAPKNGHESKVRVFRYMAILFAAAFLLLLLAFLMQHRASQETISDLTESVTSIHSLQNMVDANASLRQENDTLKEALAEAQAQLEAYEGLKEHLTGASAAMDWFWQVNEAYVRGRYALCRELMETMEEQDLVQYLPAESVTDNGRFSPADRYQEIYSALNQ